MQYHDFQIIITIKTNNINTDFFLFYFFQICDSRKIHYLTSEFHVKLPLKTGKSVITVPVNISLPEKLDLIGGNLLSSDNSLVERGQIMRPENPIGTRNEGPPLYLRALARMR